MRVVIDMEMEMAYDQRKAELIRLPQRWMVKCVEKIVITDKFSIVTTRPSAGGKNTKSTIKDHYDNDSGIIFGDAQTIDKSKSASWTVLKIRAHGVSFLHENADHFAHHWQFSESIKKSLPSDAHPVYVNSAPAKSGAGIGLPVISMAIDDAPSVFFYIVNSVHPFFSAAVIIRVAHEIMVGCVGASSEAPVSIEAGKTNSAQSTTSKIGLFGGGLHHSMEAAIMATTPTQKPQVIWIIAAVRRDKPTIKPVLHHIPASSEREARRLLVRDHVCFFAGRIPVQEVAA